jgi:hypothetical protein
MEITILVENSGSAFALVKPLENLRTDIINVF